MEKTLKTKIFLAEKTRSLQIAIGAELQTTYLWADSCIVLHFWRGAGETWPIAGTGAQLLCAFRNGMGAFVIFEPFRFKEPISS